MADHQSLSPHHSQSDEARFIEALSSLTPKPRAPRTDTLYSLVHRCYGELKGAKEQGYSYEDLAALFQTQLGKTITPGTLRKYMNRAAKAGNPSITESGRIKPDLVDTPNSLVRPKRVEPSTPAPPRPTLYTREPGTQVHEDEFENL